MKITHASWATFYRFIIIFYLDMLYIFQANNYFIILRTIGSNDQQWLSEMILSRQNVLHLYRILNVWSRKFWASTYFNNIVWYENGASQQEGF